MTKKELQEQLSVLNNNFNIALLFTGNLEKEYSVNSTIEILTTYAEKINEIAESLKCCCKYETFMIGNRVKVFECKNCKNK